MAYFVVVVGNENEIRGFAQWGFPILVGQQVSREISDG